MRTDGKPMLSQAGHSWEEMDSEFRRLKLELDAAKETARAWFFQRSGQ
jgi:hypothetical protein